MNNKLEKQLEDEIQAMITRVNQNFEIVIKNQNDIVDLTLALERSHARIDVLSCEIEALRGGNSCAKP